MDEDNNPIIKNTGDINIDTTTYFQQETQNITQNGDYIYEQNENGAWHLELKPQDSTEPTDVNINITPPSIYPIVIDKIGYGSNYVIASNEKNSYWEFHGTGTTINGVNDNEVLIISRYYVNYAVNYSIRFYWGVTNSTSIYIPKNSWVFNHNIINYKYISFFSNNNLLFEVGDSSVGDDIFGVLLLKPSKFNFNGISWMIFNDDY